jgi:hypothetical protein
MFIQLPHYPSFIYTYTLSHQGLYCIFLPFNTKYYTINVIAVVKVAVKAATDPVFPLGIVDVYGILRYSQQQRAT